MLENWLKRLKKRMLFSKVLPAHLRRLHDDWPWPFKYVPRSWTAFDWGAPKLAYGSKNKFVYDLVGRFGVEFYPKPIDPAGGWQISYYPNAPWWAKPIAWYVAKSFKKAKDGKYRQFRLGARWDSVDNYTNWPTFPTNRRYIGDDSQNTQNWR